MDHSDLILLSTSQYCRDMKCLSLLGTNITDAGINTLTLCCSKIKLLKLGRCPSVTKPCLDLITSKCDTRSVVALINM